MKKLFTLFVLICPLLALAQQTRQITGQVLDRADGAPLVGATVFIAPEETQAKDYNPQGTIAYEQGRFAFKLPVSVKKVVVSYLGYEAQTLDISGKSNFTIYLSASESKLDAVVVTGYQRIEKRKLTSSISNVKMSDIARDGVASVDEMLSGSIAGLTSTPTTGAPGGASKVKIRSTVTLNGNTDPLWVLDGMPLEGNDIPSDWSSKENVDNLYNHHQEGPPQPSYARQPFGVALRDRPSQSGQTQPDERLAEGRFRVGAGFQRTAQLPFGHGRRSPRTGSGRRTRSARRRRLFVTFARNAGSNQRPA